MDLQQIGKNIRALRIQKGLRQEDLAEMAGLSTKYNSVIERGIQIPSLETFCLQSIYYRLFPFLFAKKKM